jgi:ribose transport system ATP-binding protein
MLLQCKGISKSFGAARVLNEINLQLERGEILGLVGENGAGKSTLMNILGGILPADDGHMSLDDQAYEPATARDAKAAGIAFIHQELNLFPNLSVAENLLLDNYPRKKPAGISLLDHQTAAVKAKELLKQVGLEIDVRTPVEQLTTAQQQLVEIAGALSTGPRIIIFDEPTTSLSRHESRQLFQLIERLKKDGLAMIYISHQLEDVITLSDRIAVLRDGALIAEYKSPTAAELPSIIRNMIGRDMTEYYPQRNKQPSPEVLFSLDQLRSTMHPEPVSFHIHRGEVVGCYGLVGAGRSELARMIYGLEPYHHGQMSWKGQQIKHPKPADWIRLGMGFLTEDRREEGVLLSQNILQNVRLAALPSFTRTFMRWINRREVTTAATAQVEATQVRFQHLEQQEAGTLSGGNQQKVVLARWLLTEPEMLILDEPTKGIDLGARREIYRLINERVEAGSGILLISSEIEELLGLCDRILVMSRGRITAEFSKSEFQRDAILEAALPKEKNPNS